MSWKWHKNVTFPVQPSIIFWLPKTALCTAAYSLSSSCNLLPLYLITMHLVVFNYASFGLQSVVVFFIICCCVRSLGCNWSVVAVSAGWCSIVNNGHSPAPTMACFYCQSVSFSPVSHLSIHQFIHPLVHNLRSFGITATILERVILHLSLLGTLLIAMEQKEYTWIDFKSKRKLETDK